MRKTWMTTLLLAGLCAGAARAQGGLTWQAAPAAPTDLDARFTQGVSASYAGVSDTLAWWAGGCNFPDVPAADGGKKAFYDEVLTLSLRTPDQGWRVVGRLPRAAAYGAAVALPDGLLCLGGQTAAGPVTAVWRLRLAPGGTGLRCDTLPALPVPMDNVCGALVGRRVYLAGGNQSGQASAAVYSLSLDAPAAGWQAEPPMPGAPRTQAVAVGLRWHGEWCLYVFGGFAAAGPGRPASLSTSSLRYVPSARRWDVVAEPLDAAGRPVSLGGGAGYAVDDSTALCLGGVDAEVFLAALRREAAAAAAARAGDTAAVARYKAAARRYMTQPPAAYRLNRNVMAYDAARNRWTVVDRAEQAARAGAALAGRGRRFFWINGELKPGIRTPEVWRCDWAPAARPDDDRPAARRNP